MTSSVFRSSQRLTITVADSTLKALVERSGREGRSISNLAAYLLESSLERRTSSTLTTAQRPQIHLEHRPRPFTP